MDISKRERERERDVMVSLKFRKGCVFDNHYMHFFPFMAKFQIHTMDF